MRALLRPVLVSCALACATVGAAAQYQGPPAHFQPPPPIAPPGPDFTPEQMEAGIEITAQQCAAYSQTVYVEAQGVGICFRYYIANSGGNADEVVYWLSGDKSGQALAYTAARLDQIADQMARRYRRPGVYLARVGIDGSSGWYQWRRTWFEVEATSRAIDAINARHGFRVIHVMGQSGGAHLTGSLVGIRGDIGCAVAGSGRLAFDRRYQAGQMRRQPGLQHYDPSSRVREVALQSRSTRILVVTDPNDQRVQLHFQTGFVDAVQRAGGRIAQFFTAATDALSHSVSLYTRETMAGCLAGASDAAIEATLQRLGAFAQARAAAQQAGQQVPMNYRQAVQPFVVPPPASHRPALAGPMAPTGPGQRGAALPTQNAPMSPGVAPGFARPVGVQGTPPPPPPGAYR